LEHEPETSRAEPRHLGLPDPPGRQSANLQGARVRRVECSEDVQQGALAGPRGPQNSQNCATLDRKIYAAQDVEIPARSPIGLLDSARRQSVLVDVKQRFGSHLAPWSNASAQACRRIASTGSSSEARHAGYRAAARHSASAARMTVTKSPVSGRTGSRSMK